MSPEEFSGLLSELLETAVGDYDSREIRRQNRVLRELLDMVRGLTLDKLGNVKPTNANLKVIREIRQQLPEIITDRLAVSSVDKLTSAQEKARLGIDKYLLEMTGNPITGGAAKVLDSILANTVIATRQSLLESGVEGTIVTELEKMLTDFVTTGASQKDMVAQLRLYMSGDDTRLGRLQRHSKLFVNDTVNQFARNYIQTASVGLKVQVYLYSGGLVSDSREFCVSRNGHYWHIEEIRAWGTTPAKWQGRNPATNSSNIFYILGGYNCNHNLIPALLEAVPAGDRARMEGKGLI